MKLPLVIFSILTFAGTLWAETPKLKVYAYSSFVSSWGPGPKIIENFKKQCACEIELLDMGDTNLVIEKIARTNEKVDVILGLDQMQIEGAAKALHWKSLKSLGKKEFYGSRAYNNFVAFDWAPLSFVFRKSEVENPPHTLEDLLKERFKGQILLQDPRLSAPGLQFLAWVYLVKGNDTKAYLEQIKGQLHSLSPSWSTAYGLFKKQQAKLVFSYLSSPLYHWKEEKNFDIQSLAFKEPHPVQIELAGVPATCVQCKLATDFVRFLLEDESQKLLMNLNFMYPVNMSITQGSFIKKLPDVFTYGPRDYKRIDKEKLLALWKDVFK